VGPRRAPQIIYLGGLRPIPDSLARKKITGAQGGADKYDERRWGGSRGGKRPWLDIRTLEMLSYKNFARKFL